MIILVSLSVQKLCVEGKRRKGKDVLVFRVESCLALETIAVLINFEGVSRMK